MFKNVYYREICDALRDLVPFAQFKKLEEHPWRSVTLSKVAGYNCTKGIKSRKTFHMFKVRYSLKIS